MNRRFFYVLCATLLLPLILEAQPRGRVPPNMRTPDQLDPAAGKAVLERFRSVGPVGDLIFRFELTHQPYRADEVVYSGVLAGSWRSGHARTRVEIPAGPEESPTRLLLWNGPDPRFWMATSGPKGNLEPRRLRGEELFEPVVANVTFSPFELQMPFVYWDDYVYEGTERVKGRPAHFFLLYPPSDEPKYAHIGAVRAIIDADFNVILQAEILDPEGRPLKTIKVQSFKKVDGQWIVKRIDLVDETTRDRTRFEVTAAAVGLTLDPRWFEPASLAEPFEVDVVLDRL